MTKNTKPAPAPRAPAPILILCCRKPPGWCGTWWDIGGQPGRYAAFSKIQAKHEETCKGGKHEPEA